MILDYRVLIIMLEKLLWTLLMTGTIKKSTIIASQIPVSAWYDIIGEGTIADAILDRIVNSSHRINLVGESLRKGKIKND